MKKEQSYKLDSLIQYNDELCDSVEKQSFKICTLENKIMKLEQQIEKMKVGGNCKHEYWINTGGCYDQKCKFTGLDCTNCKDKWEIKENG